LFVNRNLPYQGREPEEPGRTPDRDKENTEEDKEREAKASLINPVD